MRPEPFRHVATLVALATAASVLAPAPVMAEVPAPEPAAPGQRAAGTHALKPELVSQNVRGQARGNKGIYSLTISDDGRRAVFATQRPRMVAEESAPEHSHVYVRDALLGTTELVSSDADGDPASRSAVQPAVSGNGRYVVFTSPATDLVQGLEIPATYHVYRKDLLTADVVLVDQVDGRVGNGKAVEPTISYDGSVVAFEAESTNLVPGDTDDRADVLVADLDAGTLELASVRRSGTIAAGGTVPDLSGDGSRVTFTSSSAQLVRGDDNGVSDVFVRDLRTDTTLLASRSVSGGSADDRSDWSTISADGTKVAFLSDADDLAAGERSTYGQVWVHDLATGESELVSATPTGEPGDRPSYDRPVISADGRHVAFSTQARDLLAPLDTERPNVFLRDLDAHETQLVSQRKGEIGDDASWEGVDVSFDGTVVAFLTEAMNFSRRDRSDTLDGYVVRVR